MVSDFGATPPSIPRRGRTLSSEVHEGLRTAIITCRFKPGEMIFESQLVREYEVSKTPVREALKLLTQEGLVRSIPGTGYIVAPITLKDVRDLFFVRQVLEAAAVERAAQVATEEQLDRLETLVGESYRVGDYANAFRWLRTNLKVHLAIAEITDNERLVRMFGSVMEDMSRIFFLDLGGRQETEAMVEGHRAILRALRRHDGRAAVEAATAEIERSLRSVQESLVTARGRAEALTQIEARQSREALIRDNGLEG